MHGMIDLKLSGGDVKVVVDISPYWPKNLSINAVYEELLRQDKKIDRRTLVAAKEGRLSKCDFLTLIRLRDFASQQAGRELLIDDLFQLIEDDT
jgi:hypothetical protein